ncbi:MAG: hypothetical protein MR868_03740 [Lachnospiraceae bacterium]|nr:hypothetical protein [Lachnospiraceae bacterium]
MAVDKLVEDDDDTYYVDANGVMVKRSVVQKAKVKIGLVMMMIHTSISSV